jgi:hypothetical protein
MDTSNIGQVTAWLNTWVDGFDFKRPGKDQSLGRDIAMKVVDQIQTRGLSERRGIGEQWPDNEPKYKAWKDANYGVSETNSRTGQMLSQKSLYGRTKIDSKEVTMIYGIDQPPDRAAFGSPPAALFARDQKVTDVQKASFAHASGGRNSKGQFTGGGKRRFYEVDESDGQAVMELCQENLVGYITDTNRANGY